MRWTPPILVRKRTVPVPTLAGWLLLLALATGSGCFLRSGVHRFLAVSRPAGSGILVVEGWIQDDAIPRILTLSASGRYARIYAVGGPIPMGARLTPHATLADLTAARLAAEGLPAERIVAVPAGGVERDRTVASARALRERLEADQHVGRGIEVVSVGTHARRTWRVFRRELRDWAPVGVIALPPSDYDPARWWQSSQGFRSVVYEGLAYIRSLLP